MPKSLHLKRTPAEQAEHDLRKARKAAKKAARRAHRTTYDDDPGPSMSARRDRRRMWDAFGEDERLDSLEARMNDYAHVPRRWRAAGIGAYDDADVEAGEDPTLMDDDQYAEWVRVGMWRRRNAAAHAEELRQQEARAAAQAHAERRLRAKEDEKWRRRRERAREREADARGAYDRAWAALLEAPPGDGPELRFADVPWPVADAASLTSDAIAAFLLPAHGADEPEGAKARREVLRATMLRFHPDKFEGRVLVRVRPEEREAVREGMGAVVRAVTALMGTKS
ncbi:hypothetical protein BC834DRAFT_909242 [Gloeopeniophorella convolvens]|nr:hypothetical protein BC834DRAFT_909242 [Gloeopeniophorella convolvens]